MLFLPCSSGFARLLRMLAAAENLSGLFVRMIKRKVLIEELLPVARI
jgi:hypothetical protein